jgi:hypothetical protein
MRHARSPLWICYNPLGTKVLDQDGAATLARSLAISAGDRHGARWIGWIWCCCR